MQARTPDHRTITHAHLFCDMGGGARGFSAEDGGFTVRILSGARGDRTHKFTDRTDALAFAQSKMGRIGMIADTTLMSDEQLKAHRAREARAHALLNEMKP